VADHVFRHEHPLEVLAVVNLKGVAHKVRDDRAGARPGLHRRLRMLRVELVDLLEQMLCDKRALLRAATHIFSSVSFLLLAS
jgi:hypothetical protein